MQIEFSLAEKIRKTRLEMGENQFDFAANCGISVETLSDLECGRANPTLKTLNAISEHCGKPVCWLLKIED